jgi:uncharacterized protein YbjT (DUF2867 family)
MRILVIGGTGLIGTKVVARLRAQGHEVVAASPSSGVDAVAGAGLAEAMAGTDVVVDVANAPQWEGDSAVRFFQAATTNLLAAEQAAGVAHHVALSVVGTRRMAGSDYMRAKIVQEDLIAAGPVPYTIVEATQFFEFLDGIIEGSTVDGGVHVAPIAIQPIAADEVADRVALAAVSAPANATLEIGGPDVLRLDELVGRILADRDDPRSVISDPAVGYFGAEADDGTLVTGDGAWLGDVTYDIWAAR